MTKEELVEFHEKILNMVINLNVSEKNLIYVADTILLELGNRKYLEMKKKEIQEIYNETKERIGNIEEPTEENLWYAAAVIFLGLGCSLKDIPSYFLRKDKNDNTNNK